jgi:predicted nucleic acid-binding protein
VKIEHRVKVYLDTSVISALFDDRNPERKQLTEEFLRQADRFEVSISELTGAEVGRTPDAGLRRQMQDVAARFPVFPAAADADRLAREYVKHGAVPSDYAEDAYHIALAVTSGADFLLSWNSKHIVRRKTRDVVQMVNTLQGFGPLEIMTPAELL